jgi:hypothetical protein
MVVCDHLFVIDNCYSDGSLESDYEVAPEVLEND